MSVEKLPRDVWSHHVETTSCVCHICGFEKSRSFEGLGSCICKSDPDMDSSMGIKWPVNFLQAGEHPVKIAHFLENGIKTSEANFESQLSNCNKVKVTAQAPTNNKVIATAETPNPDLREGDFRMSEVAVPMRRFNDSPAVVPIKKRRIQIRSPSPPPRSPSPQTPLSRSSSPQVVSPPRSPASPPVTSISPLLGYSSVSSPRLASPFLTSPFKCEAHQQPVLQPLACANDELSVPKEANVEALETKGQILSVSSSASHVDMGSGGEYEQQPDTIVEESHNEYYITAQNVSGGGSEEPHGQNLQDVVIDSNCSTDKQEGEMLIISESSSFGRDDRLHWDLNTDMDAWDASNEQVSEKVIDEKRAQEILHRSPSANSAKTSEDDMTMGYDDVNQVVEEPEPGAEEELEVVVAETQRVEEEEEPDVREEEPGMVEQTLESPIMGEEILEEEPGIMEQSYYGDSEYRELDSVEKEDSVHPSMEVDTLWNSQDAVDFPASDKPWPWDAEWSPDGRNSPELLEAQSEEDDIPPRQLPKSGKQAKSLSGDDEGWHYMSEEPELEDHVDYGDSDFRDADDAGFDIDERAALLQEESYWKGEDGSLGRTVQQGDTTIADRVAVKASPCKDQPLESSPKWPTPSVRSRPTGWDQLPEGFDSAKEALRAAKQVSIQRAGQGGSQSSPVRRGSSLSSQSASRFGPGPGPACSNLRDGYSSTRGEGYYRGWHHDDMMYKRDGYKHGRRLDDYNVHNAVRGRDPVWRPGVFGKGRAGEWVDSQPGHMNHWGPGRRRPSSGFGGPVNASTVTAARVEKSGFMAGADGTLAKAGGRMGLGRGGIRSSVSGGRVGRGGHAQISRGPPGDMDGGVHYPLRAGDRVTGINAGGRGLRGSSRPGYGSGIHDRGGQGLIDRYRGGGLESRMSELPQRHHLLDHPNIMGRIAGMRPNSRVGRSRTSPPSHRSVGHTDVSSARTPPPSSRWSSDKREPDYQDRDFKRPSSRPRLPSQRMLLHVVHGSSLTDDCDREVLAGSRQSPPVKGPQVNSFLRKFRVDSLESRPPKQSDDEDASHAGSFLKDGDYGRSGPMQESNKDRERRNLYRRDQDRGDDQGQDFRRSSSREGRFSSGPKYANTREADDDVAPRRRRT